MSSANVAATATPSATSAGTHQPMLAAGIAGSSTLNATNLSAASTMTTVAPNVMVRMNVFAGQNGLDIVWVEMGSTGPPNHASWGFRLHIRGGGADLFAATHTGDPGQTKKDVKEYLALQAGTALGF